MTLLYSLEETELKEFQFFLSKQHSGQKQALHILKHICAHLQKIKLNKIGKQDILNSRPIKKFNLSDKGFSNILSKLYHLLEEFLILKIIRKNQSYERDMHMVQIFRERKLDKLHFKKIELLKDDLDKEAEANASNILKKLKLNHAHFFHISTEKLNPELNTLELAHQNLDEFYSISKLKYICETINRSNILQKEYDAEAIQTIVDYCKSLNTKDSILFKLYLTAYELLQFRDEQVFQRLKDLFLKHVDTISIEDQSILIGYLINFAILKIQENISSYYKIIFTLYKTALQKNLIVENGFIPVTSFLNIVNVAAKLGEFDWANDFIEGQQQFLSETSKENIVKTCLAQIEFEKPDFDAALKHLITVNFKNQIGLSFNVKALTLRTLYEIDGNKPTVHDNAKAFENYIKRNDKMSKQILDAYLNFIRFTKKLLRNNLDVDKYLSELKSQRTIYFKEWLHEKAEAHPNSKGANKA